MGYNPRENPDKTKPCKSGIVEDYEKARMLIINNMTGETLRACVNTLSGMVTNKKGNQTNPSKVEEGNRLVMDLISTMDSQELFMALCPEVFRYLAN
jgi:hypothetical protein